MHSTTHCDRCHAVRHPEWSKCRSICRSCRDDRTFEAARQLQAFCDRQGWRSCFIGGIAVQRWGEPRVTRDVDLTLLTGFGGEERIHRQAARRVPRSNRQCARVARRHRVLLLRTVNALGIDRSLAALPFEEKVVGRASDFSFGPGLSIRTCSAEDLIVLKLFASPPWTFTMPKASPFATTTISTGITLKNNCGRSPKLKTIRPS